MHSESISRKTAGRGPMPRGLRLGLALALALVAAGAGARGAEAPDSGAERLRAALRDAIQQQRAAQAELATLQAAQAAQADEKKALTQKLEAAQKQLVADKAAGDKSAATLTAQLTEQKAANARLTEALERARGEGEKSAQSARELEAKNAKLTNDNILLQRRSEDLERKNLALFTVGNEILGRYEDFSLGKAIRAKEPFVGRARAKLENLVQDYEDQLSDQRATP